MTKKYEHEADIDRFWRKIGVSQAARPCSECPANRPGSMCFDFDTVCNNHVTCGKALRAEYERLTEMTVQK